MENKSRFKDKVVVKIITISFVSVFLTFIFLALLVFLAFEFSLLSVVVFNRGLGLCRLNFYPSVKFAIWLNTPRPDECSAGSNYDLILVPRENLSYFQNRYSYYYKKFFPIEDKISMSGYVDFLSFLKMLSQETVNVE